MRQSSGAMVGIVGRVGGDHGPEHVGALSCEGDDGLDVVFPLAPLAVVVGPAFGMFDEGGEGALVEDALEVPVAAPGAPEGFGTARLAQHGGEAGGGREGGGGTKAGEVAGAGDELGGEDGPHAGHGPHEGALRVD